MSELPNSPGQSSAAPDEVSGPAKDVKKNVSSPSILEVEFVTGRKALITTLISLALSPFAIVTGYYLSKVLAAPRLKVQYARAEPERKPLKINDAMTAIKNDAALWNMLYTRLSERCDDWVQKADGEVPKACLSESRNVASQLIDSFAFNQKLLIENVAVIEAWTAEKPLNINPLGLSCADYQKIMDLAQRDKVHAIDVLRGFAKVLDIRSSSLQALTIELQRLEQQESAPRTGKVVFNVGILNTGDADAVVFPDATLMVIDTKIALISRLDMDDKTGKFTVIKAHSFADVPFEVNDARTEKGALDKWQRLVRNEAQEKFTIMLHSSKPLEADGRLPE